ncbi:hypothetical protein BY458DRAFT_253605 [Sporodiniella umbellata]|nr:hypothetical protein BY458DRAFT_253605 [Sporodiniella umbellata]
MGLKKRERAEDEEVIGDSSFQRSDYKRPKVTGGPFADALSVESLAFLSELEVNNERDFMRLKSEWWEQVRKDFTGFVGQVIRELPCVDRQVLIEEAKQAVYRQHRDLRFTNDKRPYKTYLSASFSRQGRKFTDAGYYLQIQPGDRSLLAVGLWQPGKESMRRVRSAIVDQGELLRQALSTEAVQEVFSGQTGIALLCTEDKLKVAPKHVAKDHPEIELLRFKSFVVNKTFTDQQVVSEGFLDRVMDTMEALVPFVAVLNAWV